MTQDTIRIVLCRGQYCNMDRRADRIYQAIDPLIQAHHTAGHSPPVKLTTANCLSMCGAGPNCVIYPGRQVYNELTPERLIEIIESCLKPDNQGV